MFLMSQFLPLMATMECSGFIIQKFYSYTFQLLCLEQLPSANVIRNRSRELILQSFRKRSFLIFLTNLNLLKNRFSGMKKKNIFHCYPGIFSSLILKKKLDSFLRKFSNFSSASFRFFFPSKIHISAKPIVKNI